MPSTLVLFLITHIRCCRFCGVVSNFDLPSFSPRLFQPRCARSLTFFGPLFRSLLFPMSPSYLTEWLVLSLSSLLSISRSLPSALPSKLKLTPFLPVFPPFSPPPTRLRRHGRCRRRRCSSFHQDLQEGRQVKPPSCFTCRSFGW